MKTIKVSEATDIQLDWLVAKVEGFDAMAYEIKRKAQNRSGWMAAPKWSPTTDWSQMGPIIDREDITVGPWDTSPAMAQPKGWPETGPRMVGKTKLIAVARCYVTSKLGDTVEVPEEL